MLRPRVCNLLQYDVLFQLSERRGDIAVSGKGLAKCDLNYWRLGLRNTAAERIGSSGRLTHDA